MNEFYCEICSIKFDEKCAFDKHLANQHGCLKIENTEIQNGPEIFKNKSILIQEFNNTKSLESDPRELTISENASNLFLNSTFSKEVHQGRSNSKRKQENYQLKNQQSVNDNNEGDFHQDRESQKFSRNGKHPKRARIENSEPTNGATQIQNSRRKILENLISKNQINTDPILEPARLIGRQE